MCSSTCLWPTTSQCKYRLEHSEAYTAPISTRRGTAPILTLESVRVVLPKNGHCLCFDILGFKVIASTSSRDIPTSQSAVVNIYQKRSNEGTVVNGDKVMGGQGSLMQMWNESWPVWSDPTVKILLLKLLKKLMLVLIETCAQCITVCYVWGCRATNQSGFPCWPLSTA